MDDKYSPAICELSFPHSLHRPSMAAILAVVRRRLKASAAFFVLRARAAKNTNSQVGLFPAVLCGLYECPLSGTWVRLRGRNREPNYFGGAVYQALSE